MIHRNHVEEVTIILYDDSKHNFSWSSQGCPPNLLVMLSEGRSVKKVNPISIIVCHKCSNIHYNLLQVSLTSVCHLLGISSNELMYIEKKKLFLKSFIRS